MSHPDYDWADKIAVTQYGILTPFDGKTVLIVEPPHSPFDNSDSAYLVLDTESELYGCEELGPGLYVDRTHKGASVGVEWMGISGGVLMYPALPLSSSLRQGVIEAFREQGYNVFPG